MFKVIKIMKSLTFISLKDTLRLHAKTISRFDGGSGIRDIGLLESALAQPQMTLFGEYAHSDIFAMGSAYCFHVVKNHPFVDGNKRTGLLVTLAFFNLNGLKIVADHDELYMLIIHIAESKTTKEEIAAFFRKTAQPHQ